MALKLFYGPGSCAFAAMIALEQADAKYQAIRLDMAAGDQRSPQFRAINPLGRVPVLLVDDRPISELIAVLTYVASAFPEARLLPVGALQVARAYELLSWLSTSIHAYVAQILRGERFTDDPDVQEALKEPGRRRIAEQMARLDQLCANGSPTLVGEHFTVVDAFSLVIWRWAGRLGIDTNGMTHWAAKSAFDLARPQVQRALAVEETAPRWSAMAQGTSADTALR